MGLALVSYDDGDDVRGNVDTVEKERGLAMVGGGGGGVRVRVRLTEEIPSRSRVRAGGSSGQMRTADANGGDDDRSTFGLLLLLRRLEAQVATVREDMAAIREDMVTIREDMVAIREHMATIREDMVTIRERIVTLGPFGEVAATLLLRPPCEQAAILRSLEDEEEGEVEEEVEEEAAVFTGRDSFANVPDERLVLERRTPPPSARQWR